MDLEVAILPCKDGNSQGMIGAVKGEGAKALLSCPGCHSVKALPGVENPGNVLLLIEWDSVEAHEAARSHENFQKFREALSPYFGEGAHMEHFRLS